MNQPNPPAGWHPDPSGVPQLRFWDGNTWTPAVAPLPGAGQPVANSSVQHQQSAPRQKIMTVATWVTLVATLVVVGGSVGAISTASASASSQLSAEAPTVMTKFLDAVTKGDKSWSDYVNAGYPGSGVTAPVFGDASAAKSIGLKVGYDAGKIQYNTRGLESRTPNDPRGADSAQILVDFNYIFTVDGQPQKATSTRMLWLTRPYYYGDDTPSELRDEGTPTAVGPWQVASLTIPTENQLKEQTPKDSSTYTPAESESSCGTTESVLVDMSDISRVNGFLGAVCLSGGDTTNIGENVDIAALGATFPLINDSTQMEDVIGLGSSYDVPAPLSQYYVTAGGVQYVFTFAATGLGERNRITSDSTFRVISIETVEER